MVRTAGRPRRALIGATLLCLGLLAGCTDRGVSDPVPSAVATSETVVTTLPTLSTTIPEAERLPTLVGKGLQAAQDQAETAGFGVVRSHDALGRGRAQVVDRDWKVCFQSPRAGDTDGTKPVELAAVKLDETCPARDQGLPVATAAGATMPDLRGRSLRVAREALGLNASITVKDAHRGRSIILASDWQVCTQSPGPGKPYGGVPVSLTVVKFGERC